MIPHDPATPSQPTSSGQTTCAPGAVREGDYLVVRKRGTKLPPGCVLCNAAEAGRIRLTVRKFNLPVGLLALLISPVVLLMYAVAPVAKFEAGLCSSHIDLPKRLRRRAWRPLGICIAVFALGMILVLLGPTLEGIDHWTVMAFFMALPINGAFLFAILATLLTSMAEAVGALLATLSFVTIPFNLAFVLSPRPLLKAHYSDGRYLWVDGAGSEYLQQLPEIGGES
jgi:hypothetical protein